ncbi:MAG: SidA/IucD/PvdA family monooxygenase, partial [Pirellulaceae bacterium]
MNQRLVISLLQLSSHDLTGKMDSQVNTLRAQIVKCDIPSSIDIGLCSLLLLIGIGFGPSNIALAIALDEHRQTGQAKDALFIERQPCFAWHP